MSDILNTLDESVDIGLDNISPTEEISAIVSAEVQLADGADIPDSSIDNLRVYFVGNDYTIENDEVP
eukprot:UN06303